MINIWQRIRGAFLAGMLVAVPFGVTIWVLVLLVRFLESAIHLVPDALQPQALIGRPIPGLGILLALSTVIGLGLLTQSYVGRSLVMLNEALLLRVPILSSVYAGVKQLMEQLFTSKKGFEKVVIVQWPREGVWSVGFMTGTALIESDDGEPMVSLFLPTTPNPTTGFYAIVPVNEVIQTDLSVEEGFKLLMSAGIVSPERSVRMRIPKARALSSDGFAHEPTEEVPTGTPVRLADRTEGPARLTRAEPDAP